MLFMKHFKIIMDAYDCDLNTAMQMYQRGTIWEEV